MRFKKFIMIMSIGLIHSAIACGNLNDPKEPLSFLTDQKTEKNFWEQKKSNLFQVKNQLNLILKVTTDNYLRNKLEWLNHHLTQKNLEYNIDNAYRFKNFLFRKKQYTAINLVTGASAPVGTLFLISNNQINFSEDLGHIVAIETSKKQPLLNENQLLIKSRLLGGTGSYHLSGIILNQDNGIFKKIAVYPIHGFVDNPGIHLEYCVKRLPSDKNTLKFIETITLLDDTASSRQAFGFNYALQKDFVVFLRNQNNKFTFVDNPLNSKDPAFKIFEETWKS